MSTHGYSVDQEVPDALEFLLSPVVLSVEGQVVSSALTAAEWVVENA